jgi:hypothetical protein
MNELLIVSPNFPPASAPDMQRVRMSLPYFEAFGWRPSVLAVGGLDERVAEPDLLRTVPAQVPVTYTGALSPAWTRRVGVGSLALRAFGPLHRAGLRLIRERRVDLVYFSTTLFPTLALGRLWKRRTGVPFVVDMQDPWVSDYLDAHPEARPPKYRWARRLHGVLEPYTMREVDAIIAVSPAYHATLRRRYPRISESMCATVPFGAAEDDWRVARELTWANPWFDASDGRLHAVYVGRGGRDLDTSASIFFRALRHASAPAAERQLRVWCIGTDYAPGAAGRETLAPVAAREGVGGIVVESPARIPYLEGLRVLGDAHALVILGSDDAAYSPSKIYPYLLAGRPVIAVLHADGPAVALLERAGAGPVITFRSTADVEAAAGRLARWLTAELPRLPRSAHVDREVLAPWLAPELTRQQCLVFDRVLARARAEAVAC